MRYVRVNKSIFGHIAVAAIAILWLSCSENHDEGNTSSSLIKNIPTIAAFDAVVDTTKGILVGFDLWAPWCDACKILKPTLDQIVQSNQGKVIIYRVNIQKMPQIAQRFGVRGIPYVLFVKDKVPITALMGAQEAQAYQEIINRSLATARHAE